MVYPMLSLSLVLLSLLQDDMVKHGMFACLIYNSLETKESKS